jgi:hypothetical protein
MQALFHPEAQLELKLAIDDDESSQRQLGQQFATEIQAASGRTISDPATGPLLNYSRRRCLAVMHLHREPGYWSERA